MQIGDLVKPARREGYVDEPRVTGIITGKHVFWTDAWVIHWAYCYRDQSRGDGFGSAYDADLEVISESR
jgi:hypothetical protein